MRLWTDLIDPANLTDFARKIVEDIDNDPFVRILPNINIDDVVFTWFVNSLLGDVAEYRAFDAETPIGAGISGEEKTARLAALGKKYRFGEFEMLRRRSAASPESVQDAADSYAAQAAQAVVDRLTLLRAEALSTGALALNENRLIQNVSFGRAAAQTNAAPAALWSATGATPVEDLQGWVEDVQDASGVTPDMLIMSTRVFTALAGSLAASGYVTTSTPVVSAQVVNDVLVAYGLPQVTIDNRRVNGNRIVADDKIILAPSGGVAGATVWGTTVEADDPRYNLSPVALPGLVVGAYEEDDPPTKWIRGNAIALPILANPDTTLSAEVLA